MRPRRPTQKFDSRSRWRLLAILPLALCLTAAFSLSSLAQTGRSTRKVVLSTKPNYPEILKHAQVGGLVRLKATVLPNGTVSSVETIGGNPILAENATAAVKKWKYAPAPTETVEEISLVFSPH